MTMPGVDGQAGEFVGSVDELDEAGRKIVTVGDTEIGVFKVSAGYVAYENVCRHQGGPVCTGMLIGKVEPVLDGGRLVGERFSAERIHLVCPWHGMEYDIETGTSASDPRMQLRSYKVTEVEGRLYVRL